MSIALRINLVVLGLCGLLVVCPPGVNAELYKHVDKDGNVTYTDAPGKSGAKPIKPPPVTTYTPPPARATNRNEDESAATPMSFGFESSVGANPNRETIYQSLNISSPENGGSVRANGGSFAVQLAMEPTLDTTNGHRVVLLMDGKQQSTGQSTSINLVNVDRGSHTLSAQIVSRNGEVLFQAPDVTIQVLRHSILHRK